MAKIRRQNTAPELALRQALFARGIRFRLHQRKLPGSPDIVLPAARMVVFVHGCFWHRHLGCSKTTSPKNNAAFWEEKFKANVTRDKKFVRALRKLGWRVFTVWECQTQTNLVRAVNRIETAYLTTRLQRRQRARD
jgi:DNA mismatch endonuclease (patch repair protein)